MVSGWKFTIYKSGLSTMYCTSATLCASRAICTCIFRHPHAFVTPIHNPWHQHFHHGYPYSTTPFCTGHAQPLCHVTSTLPLRLQTSVTLYAHPHTSPRPSTHICHANQHTSTTSTHTYATPIHTYATPIHTLSHAHSPASVKPTNIYHAHPHTSQRHCTLLLHHSFFYHTNMYILHRTRLTSDASYPSRWGNRTIRMHGASMDVGTGSLSVPHSVTICFVTWSRTEEV